MKKSRLLLILLACFAMSGLSMAQSSVPAQVDPDFASQFLRAKPEFQSAFTFDAAKGTAFCNDADALNALKAYKATATKTANATSPTPYLTPDPSPAHATSQGKKGTRSATRTEPRSAPTPVRPAPAPVAAPVAPAPVVVQKPIYSEEVAARMHELEILMKSSPELEEQHLPEYKALREQRLPR